jgi:methyl-accepting chemotaxis protein
MPSQIHTLLQRVLKPADRLISRLSYSQKFVLIGLALVLPLVWVAKSYVGVQSTSTAFATKESVGLVYLRPATQLLANVISTRTVAVQVAAHRAAAAQLDASRAQVASAIAGVDAVQGAGATLGLTHQWSALKQNLQSALSARVSTPAAAFSRYNGLTSAIESLIAQDGNNSNMILDPDSDSYYLMDAVLNRLPALIDTAGQAGDLQTVINADGAVTLDERLNLEDIKGAIAVILAGNAAPDYANAIQNTHYAGVKNQLSGPLAAVSSSTAAVSTQLTQAVRGNVNGAAASHLGAGVLASSLTLADSSRPVIGHLLDVRTAAFHSASLQTEVIALLGFLLALYLFAGFYQSVRRSQTSIRAGLHELQHRCIGPLQESLDAMAAGDLTRSVSVDSPPIPETTRDELNVIVKSSNAIREQVISSAAAFNTTNEKLRGLLGDITLSAGVVGSASRDMSSTSEDAGRATGEIAQAVGDVAEGAERQVIMVAEVRQAAQDVAEAATESAHSAKLTADAAEDARRAAGDGASAATEATDAMQSVRESSASVTEAIGALSSESEQIGAIVQTITGIAEQTNLLALNAAIEAARAGEQGRGFAVVAEEVRKLAEDSQHAAHEIAELIGSIQKRTTHTVEVVEDGATRTEHGAAVVERTREAFERIGASVEDMSRRVEQIAAVSQQVADSASRMQGSIDSIAAVAEASSAATEEVSASTQETSASTEQIAASAHELASTANNLEQLVARFRLV